MYLPAIVTPSHPHSASPPPPRRAAPRRSALSGIASLSEAEAALLPLARLLSRMPRLVTLELPLAALLDLGNLAWACAWAAGSHLQGREGREALRAATAGLYPGVYQSVQQGPHSVLLLPGLLVSPGAWPWDACAAALLGVAAPWFVCRQPLAPRPAAPPACPTRPSVCMQAPARHTRPPHTPRYRATPAAVRSLSVTCASGGSPVWPDDQPTCVWLEPSELRGLEALAIEHVCLSHFPPPLLQLAAAPGSALRRIRLHCCQLRALPGEAIEALGRVTSLQLSGKRGREGARPTPRSAGPAAAARRFRGSSAARRDRSRALSPH
jgi:hypothetical protein